MKKRNKQKQGEKQKPLKRILCFGVIIVMMLTMMPQNLLFALPENENPISETSDNGEGITTETK